jgi:hypothetical protein
MMEEEHNTGAASAIDPSASAATAAAAVPGSRRQPTQARQQQQQQQTRLSRLLLRQQQQHFPGPPLGPIATKLLNTALLARKLPGRPNQQQLRYFRLADEPFDPDELLQLHQHYLMPFVASRDIATSNRSGAIRESRTASLLKEGRLRKQYPAHIAAPVLQLRDAVPELAAVARAGAVSNRRAGAGPVEGSNPKSRELLLVLRCFRLWEVYQGGQQQQTPTLLQLLLFGGMRGDEEGVVEVVDLAADSEGDQQQQQQEQVHRGADAATSSDTVSLSDTDSVTE